jgi:hypothetical protein
MFFLERKNQRTFIRLEDRFGAAHFKLFSAAGFDRPPG